MLAILQRKNFKDFQGKMNITTADDLAMKNVKKEELDKLKAGNAGINVEQAKWCALSVAYVIRSRIFRFV